MTFTIGAIIAIISFAVGIWSVFGAVTGNTIRGWASTMCVVSFMGGVQLVCIGVIGEYVGKIYMETKARPRYIISDKTYDI